MPDREHDDYWPQSRETPSYPNDSGKLHGYFLLIILLANYLHWQPRWTHPRGSVAAATKRIRTERNIATSAAVTGLGLRPLVNHHGMEIIDNRIDPKLRSEGAIPDREEREEDKVAKRKEKAKGREKTKEKNMLHNLLPRPGNLLRQCRLWASPCRI